MSLNSFDQNIYLESINRASKSLKTVFICNFEPQFGPIFNHFLATRKPQNDHTSIQMISNESL